MLRRLKQNIKERAGRARKTPLPVDVDANMNYTNEFRGHVEKIQKCALMLIVKWKSEGMTVQERIGEPCAVLCIKAGKGIFADSMKAINDLQNDLGRIERRTYEDLHKTFIEDTCQYFLKHENSQALEVCIQLKKRRLDRDAFSTETVAKPNTERKQRSDAAEAELCSMIATARSEFAKFPEQQRQHARAFKSFLKCLANHYADCHLAALNTLTVLTKAEQSFSTSF